MKRLKQITREDRLKMKNCMFKYVLGLFFLFTFAVRGGCGCVRIKQEYFCTFTCETEICV
jgi:hypothetical protein